MMSLSMTGGGLAGNGLESGGGFGLGDVSKSLPTQIILLVYLCLPGAPFSGKDAMHS